MARWTLQDAKNRFSAVVRAALDKGPQRITKHGRDAVVVVAADEYDRLRAGPSDLLKALRESPLAEALRARELVLERPRDTGRNVPL